jgi:hypothetical protein
VDKLSEWYLVYVRRNKKEFPKDQFPYKKTLTVRLTEDGMEKIPQLMSRLNAAYGNMGNAPFFTVSGNVGNVSFFNYCKWFIDANDLALSRQVQEAEALVRFLSGTTLVLLIALVPSILFPIAFTLRGASLNSAFYCGLLTTDVICLVMILERFKYQRRREVMMVWSCVYLIVNGGTPRDLAHDRDRLCESVFFPARSENN